MKFNVSPTTGMRDYLPEDMIIRDYVLNNILEAYQLSGYRRIETPIVEHLSLLSSGEGGEDEKLIFKVLKRGEKLKKALEKSCIGDNNLSESALRYDLTVPLSRFYAKNRSSLSSPFKVIQTGDVFRADRPQKGRYRQFKQCDIDIIEAEEVVSEIDLLISSANALKSLNLKKFFFKINDRRILSAMVKYCGFIEGDFKQVFICLDKLDKIGFEGVLQELETSGFAKDSITKIISLLKTLSQEKNPLSYLTSILGNLIDGKILEDFKTIIEVVNNAGKDDYKVVFQPTLIRGQSYYTGTVFEIGYPGQQSALGGGGRYDKMIGRFLKEDVSACGISIGFERIINLIVEENLLEDVFKEKVALLYTEKNEISLAYEKAKVLREKYIVSVEQKAKKMGKQLKKLKSNGFKYFYIVGEEGLKELS